jgi:hypothetical protein
MCRFGKLKYAGKNTSSSRKAHALADSGYEESAHNRQLMSNGEDTDPSGRDV